MAEEHVAEIEVRVRMNGQEDAVLHREVVSEKASTDGKLTEFWESVHPNEKARMRGVSDGR